MNPIEQFYFSLVEPIEPPRGRPQVNPFDTHETRFGALGVPEAMDESAMWTTALGKKMTARQMSDSHLANVLKVILRSTLVRQGLYDYEPLLKHPRHAERQLEEHARGRFAKEGLEEWKRRGLPWWGTFEEED